MSAPLPPRLSNRERKRRRPFRGPPAPPGTVRRCEWCSQEYEPKQLDQKYCQPECRIEMRDYKQAERHRRKFEGRSA